MSCDYCGLDDIKCKCYIYELQERIEYLEEAVHDLTLITAKITDWIKEKENG